MNLKQAIAEFLTTQHVKGCSEHTISNQTHKLHVFAAYMGNELEVETLTVSVLNGYYTFLVNRKLLSTSIQSHVMVIRTFLNWCYIEEYIPLRLTERFRLPKAKQKVVDILNGTEIQRLMNTFDLSREIDFRNYLICLFMLDCGLRLGEIAALRIENIFISENYMIVDGKGNKQRIVPFGSTLQQTLESYLSLRASERGSLFYSMRQKPLTKIAVSLIFNRLKKKTGIHRLHPHLLRHTFATLYLENGGNIYSLQAILGHTSLEMVKRYLHLSKSKILRDFHKFSPIDNLT